MESKPNDLPKMTEKNRDYSKLKAGLLEVWIPPVGVKSVADLWTSLTAQQEKAAWATLYTELDNYFHFSKRQIERRFSFKNNLESYFDKEPPFQVSETFLSGSWAEGLFLYDENTSMEPPDMDFMCVMKDISFSQEDQVQGCLLLREDTPFVNAFITHEDKQKMWSDYLSEEVEMVKTHRLSSRKLKEKLQKNCEYIGKLYWCTDNSFGEEKREKVTEGAAITIIKPKPAKCFTDCFREGFSTMGQPLNNTTFSNICESAVMAVNDIYYKIAPSTDIVLCISCEGWPACAREWITRKRIWPDIQSVEKITQRGFHIVPKSSPDGDFRLSFSCAETMLIEALSPLQHKVMRAFKAVVKYHQNTWSPNLKKIISSYHLKTIAFWHFERTSPEIWTEETLVHHLVTLLEELAEALRTQTLPMYFMPKVNIIKHTDDPENFLELVGNILQISTNLPAISEAVITINPSRFFRAQEREVRQAFKKLNAEYRKEQESLSQESDITLWTILRKFCKIKL